MRTVAMLAMLGGVGCGFTAETSPVDASGGSGSGSDAAPATGCADADHDGMCDAQMWLCGARPNRPADPLQLARDLGGQRPQASADLSNVSWGSNPVFLVAAAGATVTVHLDYSLRVDCHDRSCAAQLEYGLAGHDPSGCVVAGSGFDHWNEAQLGFAIPVAVPATSAVYELRSNIAFSSACGASPGWFGGAPSGTTFAYVCVP